MTPSGSAYLTELKNNSINQFNSVVYHQLLNGCARAVRFLLARITLTDWLTDWQRSAYVARSTIFIWLKHVFECYEKTTCEPMALFLQVHVVHFSKRRSVFSHLSAWRTLQKTGTCWWMVIWSQELTTQWPLWSQASIQQVASKVLIALGLWCNLSTSQLS